MHCLFTLQARGRAIWHLSCMLDKLRSLLLVCSAECGLPRKATSRCCNLKTAVAQMSRGMLDVGAALAHCSLVFRGSCLRQQGLPVLRLELNSATVAVLTGVTAHAGRVRGSCCALVCQMYLLMHMLGIPVHTMHELLVQALRLPSSY